MIIKGNTVGTTMPRADYAETNPKSAAYIKNKPDEAIQKAQTTANEAKTAAGNAQTTANEALPKAGGTVTGPLNVPNPTESAHAANKGYVDEKRKVFTTTLTVNDWEGATAPFTQRIGIEGILSTDRPHVGLMPADDIETAMAQEEAWGMVSRGVTADGSVTFTCYEEKPELNLTVQIEVNR